MDIVRSRKCGNKNPSGFYMTSVVTRQFYLVLGEAKRQGRNPRPYCGLCAMVAARFLDVTRTGQVNDVLGLRLNLDHARCDAGYQGRHLVLDK